MADGKERLTVRTGEVPQGVVPRERVRWQNVPHPRNRRHLRRRRLPAIRQTPPDAREKPSVGARLLRNTAIACALILTVLSLENMDTPWSNRIAATVGEALTMEIDLDSSLGAMSFVKSLMPESAVVFWNLSAAAPIPVDGSVVHEFSEMQPWTEYACVPDAEVRAIAPGTVALCRADKSGWTVLIDAEAGAQQVYAYLAETCVQAGEAVRANAAIGRAGADGRIYFEQRRNGQSVAPEGDAGA